MSSTDGVGTKLMVAIAANRHDTVGIDLVAMSVNDLVVQGAEPLFFLDYFATGKLDVATGRAVVAGIAEGCRQAGCALIGGETAEMPGLYARHDYDLAGFAVGAVERDQVLTGAAIRPGDVVLGMASTGVHSNGFSLVRRVAETSGAAYDDPAPFEPGITLGEALLRPTRIYVRSVLPAVRDGSIRGLAHITGGGLVENIPRVLPQGLGVALDAAAWPLLPVFRWLAAAGKLSTGDLARTFNCGIGMVAVCPPDRAAEAERTLAAGGEAVYRIGTVTEAAGERVRIEGAEAAWAA